MMTKWQEVKFGDIASFKYGKMPKKEDVKDIGKYPIYSGYRYVGYTNTYNIDKNQLIVVARGVGGTGDVKLSKEKCFLTNLSIATFIKNSSVNVQYLYYYFQIHNLRYLDSGSAQSQITISDLEKLALPLPPLEVQKKIAGVLGALDDKIELNNKINNNLEQQAMALYKNLITENEENLQEVFLSDVANITMGQSPDGSSYNEDCIGTVFYQGRAEFGFRYPTRRLFTTEPKRMAHYNDILMSVRAPVGDINVAKEDCCIGRGLAAIQSKNNTPSFILYTMYNLKKNLNIFNGEGTIFGSINKDSLNSLKINIPPENIIMKFEKTVSPIDRLIENNCKENEQLTQLRDTLLPKLMSGEIDVSNVDISALTSTDKLSFSED